MCSSQMHRHKGSWELDRNLEIQTGDRAQPGGVITLTMKGCSSKSKRLLGRDSCTRRKALTKVCTHTHQGLFMAVLKLGRISFFALPFGCPSGAPFNSALAFNWNPSAADLCDRSWRCWIHVRRWQRCRMAFQ